MSYEYHGYDFVPEKQPVSDKKSEIYNLKKYYFFEDGDTFEHYLYVKAKWLKNVSIQPELFVRNLPEKMNYILLRETGLPYNLELKDIAMIGRYVFIPSLDRMIEHPSITAIETILELYKL